MDFCITIFVRYQQLVAKISSNFNAVVPSLTYLMVLFCLSGFSGEDASSNHFKKWNFLFIGISTWISTFLLSDHGATL